MAKARPPIEVLVLGSHPCCYFAAALLKSEGAAVAQCSIPGELPHDRLVQVNPKLLELHKLLGALKKDVELTPIHGLRFLAARSLPTLFEFPSDMSRVAMPANHLNDQVLVRTLEAEWREITR